MKKLQGVMLAARVPEELVRKLDIAATRSQRSRSAELRVQLAKALRSAPRKTAS